MKDNKTIEGLTTLMNQGKINEFILRHMVDTNKIDLSEYIKVLMRSTAPALGSAAPQMVPYTWTTGYCQTQESKTDV